MSIFNIPESLIEKYNQPVPRYTSYPPANFFENDFTQKDYFTTIDESNRKGSRNLSIYVHIPFCSQKCFYCGCNTHITKSETLINQYIEAVEKEIEIVTKRIDPLRHISQIHFGGGSPNYINIELIERLIRKIQSKFDFIASPEIAIECHPADLTYETIQTLVKIGFNRFSLGVQDFNKHILNAVNRRVPQKSISDLVDYIRKFNGTSVNLDLIYGLPLQTPENFAFTVHEALKARPDRLVTFSYAHLPQINPNQAALNQYEFPSVETKSELLKYAYKTITNAGYTAIGLDHFALPHDELATAIRTKELHRNFQGYCTRRTTGQVLAFGASAISQLHGGYAQNTKDVNEYIEEISKEYIPIKKGYKLNLQEIVTREIINEIMCNLRVNWEQIAIQLNLDPEILHSKKYLNSDSLKIFETDKLIEITNEGFSVTETGRFFVRNIASAFDPLNRKGKIYSSNI